MATEPGARLLLAVGSRVAASLEHNGHAVEASFQLPGSDALITTTVQQILLKINIWREYENVHQVYLFYNRHAKNANFYPTSLKLLPADYVASTAWIPRPGHYAGYQHFPGSGSSC